YHIRRYLYQRLADAMISDIIIRRLSNRVIISIYTAQPGKVIGKGGEEIKKLREEIKSLVNKDVSINIEEIRMPELDAFLVAQNIARQIKQRVSHRRAMKRAVISAMKIGAKGIKVSCAGRFIVKGVFPSRPLMQTSIMPVLLRSQFMERLGSRCGFIKERSADAGAEEGKVSKTAKRKAKGKGDQWKYHCLW
ncbi:30S ribosomal protein S3, partial [candidate division WOR-3 bacterium 4484_100]